MLKDDGFLLDMLLAARRIRDFTSGMTREEFDADERTQSAVMYQEQILGEAANSVSAEFRKSHKQIAWDKLISTRHRLVHGYRDVELNRIWRLAKDDVPRAIRFLESIVPPDDPEPSP